MTVNPVDDVPLAVDDTTSTDEDTSVTGSAQSNDTPSGDGGNVGGRERSVAR
ncbi:Ig-like domain-containing protein [Prosthecochloris sp. SCSIO W1101]|uniref:Ig-like domain-containing protein n=1 Tax=Prosthecochloris sp. SCSIO W1101 TaxID=2992242 RepID=UPI00223CAB4C|nr:Ig-like domain-containing protein [Prosthecochloris sp. SCSIO W1101]UZJ42237.1 Ig-like domain-containing protein [Prosthecochloris sp. SCSIO W1101]